MKSSPVGTLEPNAGRGMRPSMDPYTTRLQKGGALLADMRRSLTPHNPQEIERLTIQS